MLIFYLLYILLYVYEQEASVWWDRDLSVSVLFWQMVKSFDYLTSTWRFRQSDTAVLPEWRVIDVCVEVFVGEEQRSSLLEEKGTPLRSITVQCLSSIEQMDPNQRWSARSDWRFQWLTHKTPLFDWTVTSATERQLHLRNTDDKDNVPPTQLVVKKIMTGRRETECCTVNKSGT